MSCRPARGTSSSEALATSRAKMASAIIPRYGRRKGSNARRGFSDLARGRSAAVFMLCMIPQVKVARLQQQLARRAFQPACRYVGMDRGIWRAERALLARNNGD